MPERNAFDVPATSRMALPSAPMHSFDSFTMKRTPFLWRAVGRSGSLLPIGTSANDGAAAGLEVDPADLDVVEVNDGLELRGDVGALADEAGAGIDTVNAEEATCAGVVLQDRQEVAAL